VPKKNTKGRLEERGTANGVPGKEMGDLLEERGPFKSKGERKSPRSVLGDQRREVG